MISDEDYCWFVDRALDQMLAIVGELGDERANERPDLPRANSAFAILTHCLGVMAFWGGRIVSGREVARDRAAEFVASGSVAALLAQAEEVRAQFHADVTAAHVDDAPQVATSPEDAACPIGRTQGGALVHIYEELSQHLGQMELTRDVVLAGAARAQ